MLSNVQEAYAWLDGHINFERQLNHVAYDERTFELEGFKRRLAVLGDPHRGLRTIHIAGTRGKGSSALILEALLRTSGQRTAVFTSPHLREYRERIRIDAVSLKESVFCEGLSRIALAQSQQPPSRVAFKTVFENLTALFFLSARQASVDWAIVETGLGGRLDATNVLDPGPVLLTRIGLEHTHLLGETLQAIAGEKAAILKPGGWAVTGAQEEGGEAQRVFVARADEVGAPLPERAEALCPVLEAAPHSEGLRLAVLFEGRRLELSLALFGAFQVENIQNALAMLACLRRRALVPKASDEALCAALEGLALPGRMERVSRQPEVFVDGGHCPAAAQALATTMAWHFGDQPAGLAVGMMADKDHGQFFARLARWEGWQWAWCYTVDSPRALKGEEIAIHARRFFPRVQVFESVQQLLRSLSGLAEKDVRVIATGSLYAVAPFEDWGSDHERSRRNQTSQSTQAQPCSGRGDS